MTYSVQEPSRYNIPRCFSVSLLGSYDSVFQALVVKVVIQLELSLRLCMCLCVWLHGALFYLYMSWYI